MVMIAHYAVGLDLNFAERGDLDESAEKILPSSVLQKDLPAQLATTDDVVKRPRAFNT
jgi:hypothetical protein